MNKLNMTAILCKEYSVDKQLMTGIFDELKLENDSETPSFDLVVFVNILGEIKSKKINFIYIDHIIDKHKSSYKYLFNFFIPPDFKHCIKHVEKDSEKWGITCTSGVEIFRFNEFIFNGKGNYEFRIYQSDIDDTTDIEELCNKAKNRKNLFPNNEKLICCTTLTLS